MKQTRTDETPTVRWDIDDIIKELNYTEKMAQKLLDDYHRDNNTNRYGAVDKALLLDYIEQKQREQREREARYKADIATVRQVTALEEQVKTLQKQNDVLEKHIQDAKDSERTSKFLSILAIIIAGLTFLFEIYKFLH